MYIFSALLVLTLAWTAYGLPCARVVGGSTAYEGQFPYQAAVSYKNYACCICGGSILNERYVLTTANCILERQAKDIKVMYGSVDIFDPNRTRVEADQLIPHPLYKNDVYKYDIGLIKLKGKIVFGPKVKAIALASSDNVNSPYPAVAAGWGRVHTNWAIYPSHLQFITLNVIPHSECHAEHSTATTSVICATAADSGRGVCDHDVGAPLVAGGVQVGILSYASGCGTGRSSIFTRVYHYLNWIKENSKY